MTDLNTLNDLLLKKYVVEFVNDVKEQALRWTEPPKNSLCPCELLPDVCTKCQGSRIQPIPYTELKGAINETGDLQHDGTSAGYRGLLPGTKLTVAGRGTFFPTVEKDISKQGLTSDKE